MNNTQVQEMLQLQREIQDIDKEITLFRERSDAYIKALQDKAEDVKKRWDALRQTHVTVYGTQK